MHRYYTRQNRDSKQMIQLYPLTSNPLLLDLMILTPFLCLWAGYHQYSQLMAKQAESLSSSMLAHRVSATRNVMGKEMKTTGTLILSNIDRNVSFFASTTLLLLASLTGLLAKADVIQQVVNNIPHAFPLTTGQIYLRLFTLIAIFVYAYFTLTWSMRQSSFASVMIGAGASNNTDNDIAYARLTAKLMDYSAHSANEGLRAYYFSLAVLTWFYHPMMFICSCLTVVTVLFRREFSSRTTKLLIEARRFLPKETLRTDNTYQATTLSTTTA